MECRPCLEHIYTNHVDKVLLDATLGWMLQAQTRALPGAGGACTLAQRAWSLKLGSSVSVSFYSDDGFQPMQKELYNNNDKKTE